MPVLRVLDTCIDTRLSHRASLSVDFLILALGVRRVQRAPKRLAVWRHNQRRRRWQPIWVSRRRRKRGRHSRRTAALDDAA